MSCARTCLSSVWQLPCDDAVMCVFQGWEVGPGQDPEERSVDHKVPPMNLK